MIERSDVLKANLPQYQLFSNAFKGGRFIRTPPTDTYDPSARPPSLVPLENGTYLKKRPNESWEAFELRRSRAAYRNYCQEVIRVYVATLFAAGNTIERESITSGLSSVLDDCGLDLRGSCVDAFLRRAFKEALIYGWVGCWTDYPRLDPGIATRADGLLSGRRPYSRIVLPVDLWDWEIDPITGDWTELLIHEGIHPWYRDDGGRPMDVWLRVYQDGWVVVDRQGQTLDDGGHTFDRLPFDILVCDEPSADADDEPFGHSALRDIVDLQLELYQLSSEDEDLLRKANFPFLHKKAQPDMVAKVAAPVPLGADYGIVDEADHEWIQPDGAATKNNREKMADIERQIRQIAGIATRSEESTEAHSGVALAWEYSTKLSLVKLRAESLRDFEVRLWRTWGRILEKDLEPDSIRYPSDYATAPVPEEIGDLQQLRAIGVPIEVQRALLRSIVLKQFAHRPDLATLLNSVEAWDGAEEPELELEFEPEPEVAPEDGANQ